MTSEQRDFCAQCGGPVESDPIVEIRLGHKASGQAITVTVGTPEKRFQRCPECANAHDVVRCFMPAIEEKAGEYAWEEAVVVWESGKKSGPMARWTFYPGRQ